MRQAGCSDMFPYLSDDDLNYISKDGKIPKHERWVERIATGELVIATNLNLAGLTNFANDQAQLDERIKWIIMK
jgi:transaldolase